MGGLELTPLPDWGNLYQIVIPVKKELDSVDLEEVGLIYQDLFLDFGTIFQVYTKTSVI